MIDIYKIFGLCLFLIGIVFVAESLFLMYILSLIPVSGMGQSISQFTSLATIYCIIKIISGLVSIVSGFLFMKK